MKKITLLLATMCCLSSLMADDFVYRGFSISETKRVDFAPGNLQYNQKTKEWRFAEKQWETMGDNNIECGNTKFDGFIDLFGYSTTKSNFGVMNSYNDEDYSGDFVDWGQTMGNEWFTINFYYEWGWVLGVRADADSLKGLATIDRYKGLIILPDGARVEGFKCGENAQYSDNIISAEEWKQKYEPIHAVFLPCTGLRTGKEMNNQYINDGLYRGNDYIHDTEGIEGITNGIYFTENRNWSGALFYRHYGAAVRLVKEHKDGMGIVNQNENENENRKVIENGQVVILRNGLRYNMLGQVVE